MYIRYKSIKKFTRPVRFMVSVQKLSKTTSLERTGNGTKAILFFFACFIKGRKFYNYS